MAGRGPAPKAPGRRARRNQDGHAVTSIRFERASQPELPELPDGQVWPEATRRWWAMWAESPLSDTFGVTDWDFLLDTALLHARVWAEGLAGVSTPFAAELRIRVAKFGATPEDRARLRIQFAEADERDPQAEKSVVSPARARYGNVTALPIAASSD